MSIQRCKHIFICIYVEGVKGIEIFSVCKRVKKKGGKKNGRDRYTELNVNEAPTVTRVYVFG